MADKSVFRGDIEYAGTVAFLGTMTVPAGSIRNTDFSSNSANRLDAEKVNHRQDMVFQIAPATTVTTTTQLMRLAYGTGTLKFVRVRPITAPTGGDKQYTVDIKTAADTSGSFSSVLTSPVTIDNTKADNTQYSGTISSASVSSGSAIQIVVTTSGTTGTQGIGLLVTVGYEETPS